MARISGVPSDQAGWFLRVSKFFARKKIGKELELTSIMGHSSWVLGGVGAFETVMDKLKVDPRLKSLAGVKAAALIGCPF
jgi:hypothetical protein